VGFSAARAEVGLVLFAIREVTSMDIPQPVIDGALKVWSNLLPFIVAPFATALAKRAVAIQSPKVKLTISTLTGILLALSTGNVNGLADIIVNMVKGAFAGLAAAKVRDLKIGQPFSSPVQYIPPLNTNVG
jgi:hypothetical protein